MAKGEQPPYQHLSGSGAFGAAGDQHFHGPVTQHHHHSGQPASLPWTPPPRADGFTARENDIIRVRDLMAAHRCVALVGPGGIGKTGIAAEVIFQLAPDRNQPGEFPDGIYSHNFYGPGRGDVPDDAEHERRASHLGVLSALLQQHSQAQGQQAVLKEDIAGLEARVRSLFHSQHILLYLEGCEMAQDIPALLELTGPARVLLTSRYQSHIGFAEPYEVHPLPEEEGARLLHFHARGELLPGDAMEQARWRKLSRELGGHALALRLVAAWMRGQKESPEEFSRSLQTGKFGDWAQRDQRRQNLQLLFAHSAEAVVRKHPRALEAWFALALHGHAPIHLAALCGTLKIEETEVKRALAALVTYSLAERSDMPGAVVGRTEPGWQLTHALLGEWGRSNALGFTELPMQVEKLQRVPTDREGEIVRAWFDWWEQDFSDCFAARAVPGGPARYAALQPHCQALLSQIERMHGAQSRELSVFLTMVANSQQFMGNLTSAESLYRRALGICEGTLGPEHPDTLGSLTNLANLILAKGDFAGAEPLHRRALAVRERTLGPEHFDTLGSLNNLAILLADKGDLNGAEPLYRRALSASERTLGLDHFLTLGSLNNLATLLSEKGELAEAEPLHRRALSAYERTLGADHSNTLSSLNNLAILLKAKGDLTGAEQLYQRVLKARERALGPEHPDTLGSLNNLANLLKDKGDMAGAESTNRRVLEVRERTLGPEHPDTLGSLNNLAILLKANGDLAGAEPLYRRALTVYERTLGREHPHTLASLNNLASLLYAKGDMAGAEPLAERAVRGYQAMLGTEHPHTVKAQRLLAKIREARAKQGGS